MDRKRKWRESLTNEEIEAEIERQATYHEEATKQMEAARSSLFEHK